MKEMGIPMGPRKKLMGYLRNQKLNMVGFTKRKSIVFAVVFRFAIQFVTAQLI